MDDLDCVKDEGFLEPNTKLSRGRRERTSISRSCRSLETPPASDEAVFAWYQIQEMRCRNFEFQNGQVTYLAVNRTNKSSKPAHSVGKSSPAQSVKAALEHTKMLKNRRVQAEMRGPVFVSPIQNERKMASPQQICAALMQANANHVAITPPGKKKKGEASAQQTTRILIGNVGLSSSQQQCMVSMVCGLAQARAQRLLAEKGARVQVANPSCTFESIPSDILHTLSDSDSVLVATTTESFFASTPLSTDEHDVLRVMTTIAAKELKYSAISNIVPQSTSHVRAACDRVVSAKDGSRLWFALVLLVWMATSDPRLHPLLEESGAYDFDFAISDALTRYAKILIGNRARREFDTFSEAVEKLALCKKVDLEVLNGSTDCAWDERVVDRVTEAAPDLELNEIATVVQAVQNTIKSRKSRRSTASAEMPKAPSAKKVCKESSNISTRTDVEEESENEGDDASMDTDPIESSEGGDKKQAPQSSCYTGASDVREFEKYFCHFMSTMGLEYSCSLKHIASDSLSATQQSAIAIVTSQLKVSDVMPTDEVKELSIKAAMNTRNAVAAMLVQKAETCPLIVNWKLQNFSDSKNFEFVGINSNTKPPIFLIGRLPPKELQPCEQSSKVAWCCASLRAKTVSAENGRGNAYCNASESIAWKGWALDDADEEPSQKQTHRGERVAAFCSNRPLPTRASGLARSVLTVAAKLPVSVDALNCISDVAEDLVRSATENIEQSNRSLHSGNVHYDEKTLDRRLPPLYPSNAIACGMHILESTRFLHSQTASHQNMVVVPLCPHSEKVLPLINPDDKPSAMLIVHDLKFDDDPSEHLSATPNIVHSVSTNDGVKTVLPLPVVEKPCVVSMTLIADCPISIPSCVRLLAKKIVDSERYQPKLLLQIRSLILFAGIQCHTVNEHGRVACSKDMNNSIENTSKIKLPDNHRCPSSTIFQSFVVGHCNVPEQFNGTLWQGSYGAAYDCGSVASIGFNAKHAIADDRLPAPPIYMSQEQVDEFTKELAALSIHYKKFLGRGTNSPQHFVFPTPSELWGLTRAVTPGVHFAATHLCDAFRELRAESGTHTHDTVMSIQALPFSPLTEAISPIVRNDQWTGFRVPAKRGTTFQADETVKNASILNSPLLNACRSTMLHAGSCMGENIYTNTQVVEIACTQIGLYAKLIAYLSTPESSPDQPTDFDCISYAVAMDALHESIDAVFSDERVKEEETWKSALVFDVLVLLNVCAPTNFNVGEHCILEVFAAAPSAARIGCARASTISQVVNTCGLTSEHEQQARHYWSRLGDKSELGFWKETADLVCDVCAAASSFESGFEIITKAANTFEKWVRGLWKLHSEDGKTVPGAWSPLHYVESPETMCAADVLNVFVDRKEPCAPQKNREQQRGALFGLANNAFNQVLTLLASSHIEHTVAQHARNEGNMCIRHSCCALKVESNGDKPKSKSTSPVHSDNDWECFGTLKAKEIQAERQVRAWEINNRLLFHVTKHIHYKTHTSGQTRGSVNSYKKNEKKTEERALSGAMAWHETAEGIRLLSDRAKKAWEGFSQ